MTSMSAADWNSRYAGTDLVWGAQPNIWVEQEVTGLPAGRALDLACGEGRNSIWLAVHGWQVTGVDFSAAALSRAETLSREHNPPVTVDWQCADITTYRPSAPFDLVLLVYAQLPASQRLKAIMAAWNSLAPDGILLVVAHHSDNLTDGVGGPQDPDLLYTERDVTADLGMIDCGATVERSERALRPVAGSDDSPAVDTVFRARKPGPDA
jgi:SAM-dependent methyltransferase